MYYKKNRLERFEKKIKKILFFYVFPFWVLFIISIFFWNSNIFKIENIKIVYLNNLNESINDNEVKSFVNNILSEKYFNIYSKNNFIFYPRNEIKNRMLALFQEIKSVDISWNINKKKEIFIEEEKSVDIFCNLNGICFKISDKGKIFQEIQKLENKKEKIIYKSGKKLGDNFFENKIERNKIKELLVFLNKEYGIKIKGVEKRERNLFILTDINDLKLILNTSIDLEKIKRNFIAIFKTDDFKQKNNVFIKKIKYLKIYSNKKIFYCMKGDICDQDLENI